jgi:hypothetical protein
MGTFPHGVGERGAVNISGFLSSAPIRPMGTFPHVMGERGAVNISCFLSSAPIRPMGTFPHGVGERGAVNISGFLSSAPIRPMGTFPHGMGERGAVNISCFLSSHSWGRWPAARGGGEIARECDPPSQKTPYKINFILDIPREPTNISRRPLRLESLFLELFLPSSNSMVNFITENQTGNMKKYIVAITVLLSIVLTYQSGICRSWDDLDEGEHEIYGSEREEKFPVKALFMEKEVWDNHYSFMLFWLYKYTDYPRYKSTRLFPFYYGLQSKIDNRKMTVIPPLLSYFETDGTEETSYIVFPLYYSSLKPGKSDRSILFPFIWWGRDEYRNSVSSYQTIFPVFYHSSDTNLKTGSGEYLWINPLFISWRDKASPDDEIEHMWWAPIIPLTFNYVDRNYGHRNILWLLDYSWSINNGEDQMERFWLLPLALWKRGSDGYTAFLPPVYINNRHSNGDYYYHLLPIGATWRDTEYGYDGAGNDIIRQTVTPLFARRTVTDDKSGEAAYSNFWFPIIPLFFRSSDSTEGTHTNIAWLIDWESGVDGSLKSFWLAPLVFHQTGESGYKYYIPFYCKPSGATEKEGTSFGLFHYYNWRESGSTVWSWLYYSNDESVDKLPVKGEGLPEGKEEFYYTHFLPVYWSWRSPASEGRLILPLIYNYKDKQTNIHVNLTGFARKTYFGPFNPDVAVGLANKNDTWYLDTDLSWFYDIWSFSGRVPIRNPFKNKQNNQIAEDNHTAVELKAADKTEADRTEIGQMTGGKNKISSAQSKSRNSATAKDKNNKKAAEIEITPEKSSAGIVAKKEMNRESSEYFWGWKVLFGWMAYEHADSQRHFRLLPLTWFTWDEKANDKLYVFLPFFLSYASEETKEEYFVVAPVYASQKQDRSYAKAYLINLYWDEYKAEEDYYEKTILWPFINWYSSPDKSGFRILPIVWHKTWREEGEESSRTLSLLYYSKDVKSIESGDYLTRSRINPLYYLDEETSGTNSSYSLLVPLIPLFYHGAESSASTTSSTTVTPFFYYNSEDTKKKEGMLSSSTILFPLLPVFYRHSSGDYSHWNFLGILDRCSDKDYSRFFLLPLYYSTADDGEKHSNILGVIDWSSSRDYSRFFIFPLYYSTEESGEKHHNILGLIDWWTGSEGVETSMVLPLYWWSGDKEGSSLILFPLLSYFNSEPDEKTRFVAGAYWHESPSYERQNFLYLFDHKKYIDPKYPRDEYSMLFTTMELDISPEIMEMRLMWGLLFNFESYRKSADYDADALLWLAGIERHGDSFHNRVLPLYWYSSDKYSSTLVIPPVLSYFSSDSNGDFDLALLGLVYYRNEDKYAGEDRRMWLLGTLYNEVKVPERKYHSRGSLWGILWDYETEGDTGFAKFTILKGLYKYKKDKGESEHTLFWFI